MSAETWDTDPVSVLDSETCSPMTIVGVNEPTTVLKNDDCFENTETRPKEPERVLGNDLVSEPVKETEPVRVLNSETRSTRLDAKPSDALRVLPMRSD